MKIYPYIHEGRVVGSEKPKPEAAGFDDDAWLFYHESLIQWEKSLKNVANVFSWEHHNDMPCVLMLGGKMYWTYSPYSNVDSPLITPGTQVDAEIVDNKFKITKV